MNAQRVKTVILSRKFHITLIVLGALYLSINAFHNQVWFDESYSIAIATHSFTEIWTIGSGDVHPVLFYWALHVLYLIFGSNLVVYRLFTVAGCVMLGVLGLTHIRRDFDVVVGLIFTFLALFLPYIIQMAVEIRMYSWVTFTVMACGLYGYRIVAVLFETPPDKIAELAKGKRTWAGAPCRWWVLFALSSLASAYLQYYGTMSVFFINLIVFIYLLVNVKRNVKPLLLFLLLAFVQVALFLPWFYVAVISQFGVVSGTYWAKFLFPTTLYELLFYPVRTTCIASGLQGNYGLAVRWAIIIACVVAAALFVIMVVFAIRTGWRNHKRRKDEGSVESLGVLGRFCEWSRRDTVSPYLGAFGIYLCVFLFALLASVIMNSMILYYRYLYVALGPLLLAIAGLLSHVKPRWVAYGLLSFVMFTSLVQMVLFTSDCYSEQNDDAIEDLRELSSEADLVVSSDIGIMGVTAVVCPDIPQVYMNWQKGNWGKAYDAYNFSMSYEYSWESIINDYHGEFILLAQTALNQDSRSVTDLDKRDDIELVKEETYYRPYEHTKFTVALMRKK